MRPELACAQVKHSVRDVEEPRVWVQVQHVSGDAVHAARQLEHRLDPPGALGGVRPAEQLLPSVVVDLVPRVGVDRLDDVHRILHDHAAGVTPPVSTVPTEPARLGGVQHGAGLAVGEPLRVPEVGELPARRVLVLRREPEVRERVPVGERVGVDLLPHAIKLPLGGVPGELVASGLFARLPEASDVGERLVVCDIRSSQLERAGVEEVVPVPGLGPDPTGLAVVVRRRWSVRAVAPFPTRCTSCRPQRPEKRSEFGDRLLRDPFVHAAALVRRRCDQHVPTFTAQVDSREPAGRVLDRRPTVIWRGAVDQVAPATTRTCHQRGRDLEPLPGRPGAELDLAVRLGIV